MARYGGDHGDSRYDGGTPPGGGLPTSTLVLLVVSGLAVFTGVATLAGVPALVIGVVAATSASTDRARAERLTRTGWLVFAGVIAAVVVLAVLALVLVLVIGGGLISAGAGGF
ncbi:hypothetical protein HLB09_05130 [Pseudokineococcus marinus]|uniref:DUF4190 domain-containing protein n=1 Tax=Pseudokineococcus marinus TaxID=351215 RepID=A0A849BMB9_9ACTN|nr:hypothetical protein [Pseudokineococcus marinus]